MALTVGDLSRVPSKQKILLSVLICLVLGVGYYYLYYRDASQQVATLENRLAEFQSKIKEQEVIAKNLPSFQAEVRRLEEQLGMLLDQLPNSAEIPSLLKNVSDLGKESGLDFLKFAPRHEVNKGFYAEIPVSISVDGGYDGFIRFSDKVSHLPRIVNLSDIVVSKPKATADGRMLVNVSCTATTFRFLEQAKGTPAGKGGGK